jgi:hypothetical protein
MQFGVYPTGAQDAPNDQTDTHPKIVDTQPPTPTVISRVLLDVAPYVATNVFHANFLLGFGCRYFSPFS